MAKTLTGIDRESAIVAFVTDLVKNSRDATKPDRDRIDKAEKLFNGQHPEGGDEIEDWQSQPFMHMISPMIRRASTALSDVIFSNSNFYELEGPETDEELLRILRKVVDHFIEQTGFKRMFDEFALTGGIQGAAIWKLVIKPVNRWKPGVVMEEVAKVDEQEEKRQSKDVERKFGDIPQSEEEIVSIVREFLNEIQEPEDKTFKKSIKTKKVRDYELSLELKDVRDCTWEPGVRDINESPWFAEEKWVKRYQLEPDFDTGTLNPKKREEIKGYQETSHTQHSMLTHYSVDSVRTQNQHDLNSAYTPKVKILEYFGPLLDKDGSILEEDCHFIIANDNIVLKDSKNRYWFDSLRPHPYFITTFSKIPFKALGAGIGDSAFDEQQLVNEVLRYTMDMVRIAIYGAKIVDVTKIANPEELEGGIAPGTVIESLGGDPREIIGAVPNELAQTYPAVLQLMQMLKLAGENSAGVNTSTVNPSSRARISAAEVTANQGATDKSVFNLATRIDEECIKPLVTNVLSLALQFGFTTSNLERLKVKGVLTPQEYELVNGFSEEARFEEINKNYTIKVKGFRESLERNDELARINEFMISVARIPGFESKINTTEFIEVMAEKFRLPIDRLVFKNTPQDKAREENAILEGNQQITIGDNDNDRAELIEHYGLLLRAPTQAAVFHVQAHMQRLAQSGQEVPQPPPEVIKLLGMDEQQQPTQRITGPQSIQ